MREDKRTKAYVPLYINEKNGAGLYIIGSEHIPEAFYRKREGKGTDRNKAINRRRYSCHYCCLYVDYLLNDGDDEDYKSLTLILDGDICDDFEEAIKTYIPYLTGGSGYEAYAEINEEPVEDLDKKFLPYFFTE